MRIQFAIMAVFKPLGIILVLAASVLPNSRTATTIAMKNIHSIIIFSLLVLSTGFVQAQDSTQSGRGGAGRRGGSGGGGGYQGGGAMPEAIGKISGKVLDDASGEPLQYAVIVLKNLRDSTYITGGITDSTGAFSVEKMRLGKYEMKVSSIAYNSYISRNIVLRPDAAEQILTDIRLKSQAKVEREVEVTAQREDFQLGIDKKIFSVKDNPIVKGGNAIDALKQIPTVQVDIDNNISVRGSSNLIIFINGKPSGLNATSKEAVLQQIPAENIDRIELITNPSARYDADGMAGIINIIMKQNTDGAQNVLVTLGTGTRGKHNGNLTYSYSSGKMRGTTSIGARYNPLWGNGYNNRTNIPLDSPRTSINTTDNKQSYPLSTTISGSLDYQLNKHNSLGLTYQGGYSTQKNDENTMYDFLNASGMRTALSNRFIFELQNTINTEIGLNFLRSKPEKGTELSISSNLSYTRSREYDDYRQQGYNLDGSIAGWNPGLSRNILDNSFALATLQLDYTKKFNPNTKLEYGGKITGRHADNTFFADSFNHQIGETINNNFLNNQIKYSDNFNAAYVSFSSVLDSFHGIGYQAGIRTEQTNLMITEASGSFAPVNRSYINFFPSAYLSKKLSATDEIQIGYTRRINRPGIRTLNPFADYSDPLNIRRGNPNINPEKIDAIEGTYSGFYKIMRYTATVYFRQINQTIQHIRNVDLATGQSVVTFQNLDYARNYGVELTNRFNINSWWNITGNVNFFRNQIFGKNQEADINTSNYTYNGRIINNFSFRKMSDKAKFLNGLDFQINFNYVGPNVLPQGTMAPIAGLDAGLKKELWNGRGSLGFNVSDILNQRRMLFYTSSYNYTSDAYRKRESRIAMLTFSYRFGKSASQQAAQRQRGKRGEDDQGGGEGGY